MYRAAPFLRLLPAVVFRRHRLAGLLANALELGWLFLIVPCLWVVFVWFNRAHGAMCTSNSWHKKRQFRICCTLLSYWMYCHTRQGQAADNPCAALLGAVAQRLGCSRGSVRPCIPTAGRHRAHLAYHPPFRRRAIPWL